MEKRCLVFFSILLLMLLVPLTGLALYYFVGDVNADVDGWAGTSVRIMLSFITNTAPYVIEDIGLFTEATPAVLAAALMLTSPQPQDRRSIIIAIVISAITYMVYLHLSAVFSITTDNKDLLSKLIIIADWSSGEVPTTNIGVLYNSVSALRTLSIIVFGSLFGLALRKNTI